MERNSGQLFHDRYLLKKKMGSGSFGEVWLAGDIQLDMDVAVKIYIALDNNGIEEFKTEFKNTYELNHPNLLHASHFDVCNSSPYLVMPFCPASSVSLAGSIDESTMWRFIHDVAEGLAYLHEHDIVHRDIKPDNLLIDGNGKFLITDFGISKKMRSTLRRNSTLRKNGEDNFSGTVGYMGPEMFTAKPELVKATDIWALGATVYELAAGELPFGGLGGVMLLHGAELPELPNRFSRELNDLFHSCLAKNTWDRPLAADLVENRKRGTVKTPGNSATPSSGSSEIRDAILKLEAAGEYKIAYNQCLECIKTNIEKEFAQKKMEELVPLIRRKSRNDNAIQTLIIIIVSISVGIISLIYFFLY